MKRCYHKQIQVNTIMNNVKGFPPPPHPTLTSLSSHPSVTCVTYTYSQSRVPSCRYSLKLLFFSTYPVHSCVCVHGNKNLIEAKKLARDLVMSFSGCFQETKASRNETMSIYWQLAMTTACLLSFEMMD